MYGSDQAASVEPQGFSKLVKGIKTIESAMGNGIKRILSEEIPIAENLRQHLSWKASGYSKNIV